MFCSFWTKICRFTKSYTFWEICRLENTFPRLPVSRPLKTNLTPSLRERWYRSMRVQIHRYIYYREYRESYRGGRSKYTFSQSRIRQHDGMWQWTHVNYRFSAAATWRRTNDYLLRTCENVFYFPSLHVARPQGVNNGAQNKYMEKNRK